jgi:hypothetical protein
MLERRQLPVLDLLDYSSYAIFAGNVCFRKRDALLGPHMLEDLLARSLVSHDRENLAAAPQRGDDGRYANVAGRPDYKNRFSHVVE